MPWSFLPFAWMCYKNLPERFYSLVKNCSDKAFNSKSVGCQSQPHSTFGFDMLGACQLYCDLSMWVHLLCSYSGISCSDFTRWCSFSTFFSTVILEIKRKLSNSFLPRTGLMLAHATLQCELDKSPPSQCRASSAKPGVHISTFVPVRKRCYLWVAKQLLLQDPCFGLQSTGWILALT